MKSIPSILTLLITIASISLTVFAKDNEIKADNTENESATANELPPPVDDATLDIARVPFVDPTDRKGKDIGKYGHECCWADKFPNGNFMDNKMYDTTGGPLPSQSQSRGKAD